MNTLQKRLRTAFGNVCHLCQSDRNASDWIERAHKSALEGERRHRKGVPSRYRMTAADAACFFATKWFLDIQAPPKDYTDAASLREDCLFALAARDAVKKDPNKNEHWHYLYADLQWLRELDYVKEFTRD